MNKFSIVCCLSLWCALSPLSAQKKKQAAPQTPTLTAEQLIQSYRFDDAAEQLRRDIEVAQKAGKNTERLEADMQRAMMGMDMLRGTERTIFVDSFKVHRDQVLATLKFSPEVGHLTSMSEHATHMDRAPKEVDRLGYMNELGDKLFFSASAASGGVKTLWSAYRKGNGWGKPEQLEGLQSEEGDQCCPFVMPDGVTVYFAEQGGNSLGGYDLFVTRYNPETKQFLKAENLGMPFNSPANDYLLAIDEAAQLGWLVTDRHQQADTVCVYVFIPSASRDVYDWDSDDQTLVVHAAQLHSIATTQTDSRAVAAARERLRELGKRQKDAAGRTFRFVINDQKVYTSLDQFRSGTARRIATEVMRVEQELDNLRTRRDDLQREAAKGNRSHILKEQLREVNEQLPKLQAQYATLCKNMRLAETK
ncbi:hypothetical protein MR642_02565 [bacterium]|nr:hypothetical protein [bacterium]